ncbi:MAG: ribose 5-phosphate isomerase B [Oscillospiraceae bacterium]|jgi:ribose 5-phosphate isomerase B|nr:ribose 5-phosphate isomerase B [Oscillospiraceae bacterium]
MKIAIGSDHGGYTIKEAIKNYFCDKSISFKDFGTNSNDSANYVEFAFKVANAIAAGEYDKGVLCCGTGIGVSIAANKMKGIRAALCSCEFCAEMSRRHNDANILCLGGRTINSDKAIKLTEIFIQTSFEAGRHFYRIQDIKKIEEKIFK